MGLAATTYYVSPLGLDTNAGTASKPFRTIQHGLNKAANGDTVLVHTGRYVERLTPHTSVILSNVPNEKPLLDGTGLQVIDDHGLIWIKDLNGVTVRGLEIANYKTTNSQAVPAGIFVEGKCDRITIQNNLIHNIENNGPDAGAINGFGIAVYGNSSVGMITNLVIDGNEIHDTKTGSSETLTLNGNVNGFRVTRNWVHNVNNIGIDCIGFEGTSPIAGQDQARNGLIELNRVSAISSVHNPAYAGSLSADGIYVDGGTGIVIDRNVVTTSDIGIEVASEHGARNSSNVIVRDNLVYASQIVGLSIGGYDATRGGTLGCSFINNTFAGNDTTNSGSGEVQIQFHTSGNVFKNNIVCATSQGVLFSSQTGTGSAIGLTSDNNLFYAPANASWTWNANSFDTLSAFTTATHEDRSSLFADPLFVSASARNYHLAGTSPALNRGVNLGALLIGLVDLDGAPRIQGGRIDLGCYELPLKTP